MSSKTALVVDDSKSSRFALRKFLESHNYEVELAASAGEAYRALQIRRPDVVFLDHVMPEIDGFDALRHIKADPATVSIPVVICSSHEGEAFVRQAQARGAADVLQKPPSADQLERVLKRLNPPAQANGSAVPLPAGTAASVESPPGEDPESLRLELARLRSDTELRMQSLERQLQEILQQLHRQQAAHDRLGEDAESRLAAAVESATQASAARLARQLCDALLAALQPSTR